MNDQERAELHLRTIRRLMERATIYSAISSPTALAGGLLSLAASALLVIHNAHAEPGIHFTLLVWLAVLLLTVATNIAFIFSGAARRGEPVFSGSLKAAMAALAPPLLVAACLSVFYVCIGLDDLCLFGITWAACYGLGLLATSHFAPRSLKILGWTFLLTALLAIFAMSFGRDPLRHLNWYRLGILFMALTFGLYHLVYAICTWPRSGTEPGTEA